MQKRPALRLTQLGFETEDKCHQNRDPLKLLISGRSRTSQTGAVNPEFGAKSYIRLHFCRKLHENERNWTERGRLSLAAPLDPLMLLSKISKIKTILTSGETEMSLGTRTLNDTDRQPLSTTDSDLKLSLGFLDSGAAAQAAAADKETAKKTRQISGENVSKPKGPFTPS